MKVHKESQDIEMHVKLLNIYRISIADLALSSPVSKAEENVSSCKQPSGQDPQHTPVVPTM